MNYWIVYYFRTMTITITNNFNYSCEMWVSLSGNEDNLEIVSTKLKYRFICGEHFSPSQYFNKFKTFLKTKAFPDLNLPPPLSPAVMLKYPVISLTEQEPGNILNGTYPMHPCHNFPSLGMQSQYQFFFTAVDSTTALPERKRSSSPGPNNWCLQQSVWQGKTPQALLLLAFLLPLSLMSWRIQFWN